MDRIIEWVRNKRKIGEDLYWMPHFNWEYDHLDIPGKYKTIWEAKISATKRQLLQDRRRRKNKRYYIKYYKEQAKHDKKWGIRRLERLGYIWNNTLYDQEWTAGYIDWPLDQKKGGCQCFHDYPEDPMYPSCS